MNWQLIVLWFTNWFIVWGIYNYFLKEKKITFKGQLLNGLFFLLLFILSYFLFSQWFTLPLKSLLIAFIITIPISLIFYFAPFKIGTHFINKRTLYLSQINFNLLYQQLMVFILIAIFFNPDYQFLSACNTILLFTLAHTPLLFFKHIKLRYVYVLVTIFCGAIFFSLIAYWGFIGSIYSYLIHYTTYLILSLWIKDEALI
jgi:hypothetical protein